MPKTLVQMKKRLEEAMNEVSDAEEIIPLLKEVIAKFELVPADLFELSTGKVNATRPQASLNEKEAAVGAAMFRDSDGNTWAGKGRRPTWLNEALARGKTLEEFRSRGKHLRSAK